VVFIVAAPSCDDLNGIAAISEQVLAVARQWDGVYWDQSKRKFKSVAKVRCGLF